MKWLIPAGFLVGLSLTLQARLDDPKEEAVTVLKRADLKPFEGKWVMAVETKKGWKGKIRADITLYEAGSKKEDFGRILYHYDLERGAEKSSIENAPAGGIGFAVVSRGKKLYLVTAEREGFGARVPFKVDPKVELSAPVTISDDKMQIDFSKSVKAFCFPFEEIDLDWTKLEFRRLAYKKDN